ncbi:uncharacterized protein MONBRDRAFT_9076 [Monosiga brevicollis MX1]|uniref:NAD(P)-binding domain-containing protein n=1 Tax=Monosiga brevicollis TaxID=81824 RepID=A9V207_MONBE|nr:uncharacterized protein MONBRDRAFT_9076 [Monosiga brevicollis MX1]EDQ88532.1 predicted protein [Monosiga brevicollis MX1]|eukprot:XP_001746636.1 hypothetical protein [Monosiga brevicollis MX1]
MDAGEAQREPQGRAHQPQRLLITGGAGFIASHVAKHFLTTYETYELVVVDALMYCANRRNLPEHPRLTFVHGDITDLAAVEHLLCTHRCDTILHFAAQTHVDRSFANSFSFTHNNMLGTHVMLEAAKLFVHVSTDEVYGETVPGEDRHFLEKISPLNPTNPYAASKAAAEMMVKAYQKSYDLPVIVTRGNNVYGPHQHPEKLVPKLIYQALRDQCLTLHGDGSQQRGYVFVQDVARAFDILVHRGTGLHLLRLLTGSTRICNRRTQDRCFQDRRYLVANENLLQLGWAPGTSWRDGLRSTIAWQREHPDYWPDLEAALEPHYPTPAE